jgi:hypothetical protein
MFSTIRKHARSAAVLAVAAALTVGGVAVAQNDSGNGSSDASQKNGKRMPPPPPGMPMSDDLTYAQLHVRRDGKSEVIRLDRGEITAVDQSSITVSENDGNEVTIPVDDETEVMARPGQETEVTDLKVGQDALVSGPEGEAAETVLLPPPAGKRPHGMKGAPPGPPPMGSAQPVPMGRPGSN